MNANQSLEDWLREEVTAGHREYLRDPSKAMLAENVLQHLKDRRSALRVGQDAKDKPRR